MSKYLKTWWTIIFRPIYFYTRLKEADWREESLTFFLKTFWLLALVATVVVYIIQYLRIGRTLVEGVSGLRFVIVLPVLITLAFVFFVITFLILGGLFTFAFFILFYFVGILLHYTYLLLGGKGSLNRMIQSMFYSSAIMLVGVLIFLLMILTRFAGMDFSLFRYGYNFIYFLILLYIYGLWAVAGRKTYGISKPKAFIGAVVPVVALLIFGFLFDKIAVSRLAPWIT